VQLHNLSETLKPKLFCESLERDINKRVKPLGDSEIEYMRTNQVSRPSLKSVTSLGKIDKRKEKKRRDIKMMTFVSRNKDIDVAKIEDALQLIRGKYSIKNNLYKIFTNFASTSRGRLTLEELGKFFEFNAMPLNDQELKLVAALSKNSIRPGTDITIVEFMQLMNNEAEDIGKLITNANILKDMMVASPDGNFSDLANQVQHTRQQVFNALSTKVDTIERIERESSSLVTKADMVGFLKDQGLPEESVRLVQDYDLLRDFEKNGRFDVSLFRKTLQRLNKKTDQDLMKERKKVEKESLDDYQLFNKLIDVYSLNQPEI
jgi:hypothetical protein